MDKKVSDEGLYKEITNKMLETFKKKNHDYGNSFFDSLDKKGIIAAETRLSDKMSRLESFVSGKNFQVNDESALDTVLDSANYLIMTAMWMMRNDPKEWVKFINVDYIDEFIKSRDNSSNK